MAAPGGVGGVTPGPAGFFSSALRKKRGIQLSNLIFREFNVERTISGNITKTIYKGKFLFTTWSESGEFLGTCGNIETAREIAKNYLCPQDCPQDTAARL